MNSHQFLASSDWVGFVIFLLLILLSNLGKLFQKNGEEEPPENYPAPPPIPRPQQPPAPLPRHPRPVQRMPQPPVYVPAPQPQQPRRTLEEQLQDVLKRAEQRTAPPPPLQPPALPTPAVEQVRRLIKQTSTQVEAPPASRRPARPVVKPAISAPQQALWYRERLRDREAIRHAVVLREILGPPAALREE